ncbi:hypothetical protein [Flavobacterium pedocola]
MNKYRQISDFICGRLILIDYDISFDTIMNDFFRESEKEHLIHFKEEVQKLLLDIESNAAIPFEEMVDRSNFNFNIDGLKELCEDILAEYSKYNL